ncbi:MAG: histidine kinase N-terminal 7TM domain-containing protein [Smithellaceae bacterium]
MNGEKGEREMIFNLSIVNQAPVFYVLSVLFVLFISGLIANYCRRHRDIAGVRSFMWVSVLLGLLALFEGLSILAPTGAWALFWFEARFLCLATIPVLWLIFVLQFTGYTGWITPGRQAALFMIPIITQVMIWTNSLHGLWVKQPVAFFQAGSFFIARIDQRIPGPWMWVHFAYSYLLVTIGLTLLSKSESVQFGHYQPWLARALHQSILRPSRNSQVWNRDCQD